MQCMHPSRIRNPGWTGLPSSPQSFLVPCGRCVGCRIARTREWAIRCLHETESHGDSVFLTLTYDDDHIPLDGSLNKKHFQDFMKRLRKRLGSKRLIKYFGCGEYGETTHRPHYHAIIFGVSPKERYLFDDCWTFGFNTVGCVSFESCKYVAGYVQKKLYGKESVAYGDRLAPFLVCSNGIGYNYCVSNSQRLREDKFITVNGVKLSLPRYYRKILGIDTEEFYADTQEHRDEIEKKLWSRVPVGLPLNIAHSIFADEQAKARLQYEKNMEAKLSLKDRTKC